MVPVSSKNSKIEPARTLGTRSVFISHSHADRGLAKGLGDLVEAVFSGLVVPFASSDPAPTGGIMPGEEWFSKIHVRLQEAEAVWVIATPFSTTRPWVYWESGIGRAICPNGVVVLRVGLPKNGVPSPLSAFQSYDGLSEGDEGVSVMLGKVAAQIGMKLQPALLENCVKAWIDQARAHEPDTKELESTPSVAPEQLDRLEAMIARLEAAVAMSERPPARGGRARRGPPARGGILSAASNLYDDVDEFIADINATPPDIGFRVDTIDGDGDVRVETTDEEIEWIWLQSTVLPHLTPRTDVPERTATLIDDIIRVYRGSLDSRAPGAARSDGG